MRDYIASLYKCLYCLQLNTEYTDECSGLQQLCIAFIFNKMQETVDLQPVLSFLNFFYIT